VLAAVAAAVVEGAWARGQELAVHGWVYDQSGQCIEQPAEPEAAGFKDKIKHVAYPVERLGGLLWAYLGPEPKPLLPRWDVLCWENGRRWIEKHEI